MTLVLSACGGAKVGDKCSEDGYLCNDAATALQCVGGTWVGLPCRGPAGCVRSGSTVNCDMSKNVAGDACATSVINKGICSDDGKSTLQCLADPAGGASLKVTNTCRTCTVTDAQVICQP